jgi:hypothetical protein
MTERKTYRSFDAYVADYPEAERFRAWLTNVAPPPTRRVHRKVKHPPRPPRSVTIIPAEPNYCGLPGDYFWTYAAEYQGQWFVYVNDCDDGTMHKACASEAKSLAEIEALIALSPFNLRNLYDFGYEY